MTVNKGKKSFGLTFCGKYLTIISVIDLCVSNGTIHNLSLVFLKKDRNSDCWERI